MNFKERLKELNLSQSKAARLADIPQSNFNLIVNGKAIACPAWRKRISTILELPESEVFPEFKEQRRG